VLAEELESERLAHFDHRKATYPQILAQKGQEPQIIVKTYGQVLKNLMYSKNSSRQTEATGKVRSPTSTTPPDPQ
jgi:hypothetical protein